MGNFMKCFVSFVATIVFSTWPVQAGLFGDSGRPIAGPVDIVIRKFEMCPRSMRGDDGLVFHNITGIHAIGRPYEFLFTSNVSLDFPLDDGLTSQIHLSQFTARRGWTTGMKDMRFQQLCSTMSTYAGKIWENALVEAFGKKVPCPVPPIKHAELKNVTFSTKTLGLREFVYGRWRCDVLLIHEATKTTKACIRVSSDIAPAASS